MFCKIVDIFLYRIEEKMADILHAIVIPLV